MIRDLLKEVGGTVLVLLLGMVFFTIVLVFVEWRFESDAQVFQVISNIVSGFAGAFFAMMTSKAKNTTPPPTPIAAPNPAPSPEAKAA